MANYQLVFSPTGGTMRVANAITQGWDSVQTIDLSVPGTDYGSISLEPGSLALIAMPVFGGVAPQIALERLAMVRGNGVKCALAAVYGNRDYEDALAYMAAYADRARMVIIAAVTAVAEHSIFREYATGRPDAEDIAKLVGFGERIAEKAAAGDVSVPTIPGRMSKNQSRQVTVPKASSVCTACGLCAQNCPVGAIPASNPRTTDKKKCITCMRCVAGCPSGARSVGGATISLASAALKRYCVDPKPNKLFI